MLRRRVVALGLASTAMVMCGSAGAAQAPKVATAEPPPAATQPAPAPVVTPTDPIGLALQQRLTAPPGKKVDTDRAALATFYTGRVYAPVWLDNAGLNAKANAAIAEIGKAGDWGLDAREFTLPALAGQAAPSVDALAELDSRVVAVDASLLVNVNTPDDLRRLA